MKYMLQSYSSNKSLFFGCEFKKNFMSGGPGYILSKNALKELITVGFNKTNKLYCLNNEKIYEDVQISYCMKV